MLWQYDWIPEGLGIYVKWVIYSTYMVGQACRVLSSHSGRSVLDQRALKTRTGDVHRTP